LLLQEDEDYKANADPNGKLETVSDLIENQGSCLSSNLDGKETSPECSYFWIVSGDL
jgi:hypothetical protein